MKNNYSDWKVGETKSFFISFAYGLAPGRPKVTGRSELMKLHLHESYMEENLEYEMPEEEINWGAISAMLILLNLLVFTVLFLVFRRKLGKGSESLMSDVEESNLEQDLKPKIPKLESPSDSFFQDLPKMKLDFTEGLESDRQNLKQIDEE